MRLTKKATLLLLSMAAMPAWTTGVWAETPSSNIAFYSADPIDDPEAYPYVGRALPGYISGIVVPFNGNQVTVSRESADSATGFSPLADAVLNQQAPASAYVMINQISSSFAVSIFGEQGTYDSSGAHASPNPGVYITPQRVRFQVPDALTAVEFSVNGGPDQTYDGTPIPLVETSTITYQGTRQGNPGPTKTIVYTIDSLPCSDIDGDDIPDRIEPGIGLDPFLAEGDANKNNVADIDELLRGAPTIIPASVAPNLVDSDGDKWSDYDETLRGTSTVDETEFPAAPSLDAVELVVSGGISPTAPGVLPPGNPIPAKPAPDLYEVEVLTPGGLPLSDIAETDELYSVRTSGEQFHLVRAKAIDGSGRLLLAVVPPRGLCIDTDLFCDDGDDLGDWRASYLAQYEANIYAQLSNEPINPRSTAAAFLLNRYYELEAGEEYLPGVAGHGPDPEVVLALRAARNEAELFAAMEAAVSTEMVTVVTDYFHFATAPGEMSMIEQLAAIFRGETVDNEFIPAGVRTQNFATVASQTANFFNNLGENETVLTGAIGIEPDGFELDVNGTVYRLTGLADTFAEGSTVSVRAIVDIDDCNFTSPFAKVTELISRTPAAIPPGNDSDNDNLDDDWELLNFGDLDEDGQGDNDNDGQSNEEEEEGGTNPNVPDIPVFADYQGDADLSQFVNASDLAFVQNNLGDDYTCASCRGRGDADGNGIVDAADFDAVGDNLFAEYLFAPSCVLVENSCNKRATDGTFTAAPRVYANSTMSISGLPASIEIGEVIQVTVEIDTDGEAIRAAGTRLLFNGSVLEVVDAFPNSATFDVYSIATPGAGFVDVAGVASADRTGIFTFATISFRGKDRGATGIMFSADDRISSLATADGSTVDGLQTVNEEIVIGSLPGAMWTIY